MSQFRSSPSTLLNPCNNELAAGPVDVLLNVKVTENADGVSVKGHRSFHGELTGGQGNTYQVTASSQRGVTASAMAAAHDER